MNINYNINHKLLRLNIFKDKNGKELKGHDKRALLITLSCIAHFDIIAGIQCTFYKGQMSKDWDISQRYFGNATKILLTNNIIEEIRPYCSKTQTAAIYALSIGYRRQVTELYTPLHKAIDAASTVNNPKKRIIRNSDSFSESSFQPETNIQDFLENIKI